MKILVIILLSLLSLSTIASEKEDVIERLDQFIKRPYSQLTEGKREDDPREANFNYGRCIFEATQKFYLNWGLQMEIQDQIIVSAFFQYPRYLKPLGFYSYGNFVKEHTSISGLKIRRFARQMRSAIIAGECDS